MKDKYLYTRSRYHGLERRKITRQTEKTYWIYINDVYEQKIPKKSMKVGSGFGSNFYYEETPELKEEYRKIVKYEKYCKRLKILTEETNEKIWDQVLEIEIEG